MKIEPIIKGVISNFVIKGKSRPEIYFLLRVLRKYSNIA